MQTLFWIFAGLMLLVATTAVLAPLRRPRPAAPQGGASVQAIRQQLHELDRDLEAGLVDPDSHTKSRAELQRTLLLELSAAQPDAEAFGSGPVRRLGIALGLLVPLVAIGTYQLLRTPDPTALQPGAPGPSRLPAAPTGSQAPVADSMETLAARLAARLAANPDDGAGWALLARSYVELRQFDKAVPAFERAAAKGARDAQLLADHADALAMAGDRTLTGKPASLIDEALKLDPDNDKALMLAGSAAFERREYAAAIRHWERAAAHNPPDTPLGKQLAANVAEARAMQAGGIPPAPSPAPAATATIAGEVTIAPELAAQVAPGDTLFLYARAASGPKMPLAILRARAAQLPMKFELDDSLAMTPAAKLSSQRTVTVVARVSKSGDAVAQAGDLVGQVENVAVGARMLKVRIDARWK